MTSAIGELTNREEATPASTDVTFSVAPVKFRATSGSREDFSHSHGRSLMGCCESWMPVKAPNQLSWLKEHSTVAKLPLLPKNPERVCWGCSKYCSDESLDCGNGAVRTQHPIEIFGDDWLEFSRYRANHPQRETGAATPTSNAFVEIAL